MYRLCVKRAFLVGIAILLVAVAVVVLPAWGIRSRPEEDAVVRWVCQNGMRIDSWQAGKLPGRDFDVQAWIREGRAIPNIEDILQRLLLRKKRDVDPILLVQGLGYVGTSGSVPLLTAQLEDKWEVMRCEAIWALGRVGGREVKQLLEAQVCHAATFSERHAAAHALMDVGDADSIEIVSEIIKWHKEEERILMEVIAELRHKGIGPRREDATEGKPSEVSAGTEQGVAGSRCPLSQPSTATAASAP